MRESAFVVSASLMLVALMLPAFLHLDNPFWKNLVFHLAWILFVIGLIGGIISCGDWPYNMPIDGGS